MKFFFFQILNLFFIYLNILYINAQLYLETFHTSIELSAPPIEIKYSSLLFHLTYVTKLE